MPFNSSLAISPLNPLFASGSNPPNISDLAFDFNTRTDLVLNNRIGDNGSLIGGYVADFGGTGNILFDSPITVSGDFVIKESLHKRGTSLTSTLYNINTNGFRHTSTILYYKSLTTTYTLMSGIDIENKKANIEYKRVGNQLTTTITGDVEASNTITFITDDLTFDRWGGRTVDLYFDGYGYYLNINNQLIMYFNNLFDSVTKDEATNNGVTFTLINDIQLQSVKDALNEGYYINGSGNKIINPQYAATTEEVVLGGRFYNGIECFADFEPSEETMAAQSELVTNGGAEGATDFIDSNSDGLADGFNSFADTSYSIIDTGTRYQRIEKTGAAAVVRIGGFDNSKMYHIKIKGINDSSTSFGIIGATSVNNSINVGNYEKAVYLQPLNNSFYLGYLTAGYFDFEEISIKEIPAASYLFNRLAQETASTDSVYYDSDYTFRYFMGKFDFDISPTETITAYGELDYNVIQTYLTSSYMQKIFTKISQNYGDGNEDYIDRILAYTTQKTGDELLRVLRYINYLDYTLNYVQDENGDYVLDIYNRPLTE